jgi:F-type H+-transporting ATPase subunit delta
MKSTKVAARYAKALLELATEQNKVERIADDMFQLAHVNTEVADFAILLNSPVINSDKKMTIFKELFGSFDQLSMMFIELITKNRRENLLGEIAHSYEAQLKQSKGITPVTLISAVKLNEQTKKDIIGKVQVSVKGTLEVTEEIDESLIGGFIIRMDDKQIDASVSSQLASLKQTLTR